jgi:hypothetical protein
MAEKQKQEEPKQPAKPKEADLAGLTPSAYALAKVGPLPDNVEPGSAEAKAHGDAYQAAKNKQRYGY